MFSHGLYDTRGLHKFSKNLGATSKFMHQNGDIKFHTEDPQMLNDTIQNSGNLAPGIYAPLVVDIYQVGKFECWWT